MKLIASNWETDKQWADRYFTEIRKVLTELADEIIEIKIAPDQEDREQATDYIITLESGQIACRIRRPNCRYRDLTIRAWRLSGKETELSKIRKGFGRWYLYAWTKNNKHFDAWIFIDLNTFRDSGLIYKSREIKYNPDGKTGFIHFSIQELSSFGAILKCSPNIEIDFKNNKSMQKHIFAFL